MRKFYTGDVVQFGLRGTTRYDVFRVGADTVDVQSQNTGTNKYEVDPTRLVLVEGGPERFKAVMQGGKIAEEGIDFVSADDEDEPIKGTVMEDFAGIEQEEMVSADVDPETGVLKGTVVSLVPERSSYSKAILNGLQAKAGHVFEGVSLSPKARARRKVARRAAKISRKANR